MKTIHFMRVRPWLRDLFSMTKSGEKAPAFASRLKVQAETNRFFLAAALAIFIGVGAGAAGVQAQTKSAASRLSQDTPDATASLPHDSHDGLTISANPWTDKLRTKDKFGKANPLDAGILPVEVFLQNSTDHPIQVNLNTVQLEVHLRNGSHQDIDWLSADDVAGMIAHPGGAAPSQPRRIAGIPLPNGDKKAEKYAVILRPLTLDSDTVSPMGSLHGFLYFDVSHDPSLADSSVLYVPDVVVIPTKKTLMFYEVPLGKAAKPQ